MSEGECEILAVSGHPKYCTLTPLNPQLLLKVILPSLLSCVPFVCMSEPREHMRCLSFSPQHVAQDFVYYRRVAQAEKKKGLA